MFVAGPEQFVFAAKTDAVIARQQTADNRQRSTHANVQTTGPLCSHRRNGLLHLIDHVIGRR